MKRLRWIGLALLLVAPLWARASDGFVTANVNLRAGPDVDYPWIATIPAGSRVSIQGCTEGWGWCDVVAFGNRGWMVIALTQVDRPDPKAIDPARVDAIAQPLAPAFGNELVEQFAGEAKRRVGVKINKDLLETLRKELAGTAPVGE